MPDIVTSKTFVDGEKGITATKLNQIISGAVIQPSFVSGKPASSTLDPTDQLLEVKGAGTYATITGQQLIDSVSASVTQNITPTIWSVRLRSFNAVVGNPTFEVDQRTVGAGTNANNAFALDRWVLLWAGTMAGLAKQQSGNILVPGTNFAITQNFLRVTVNTVQATLGAGDYYQLQHVVEGPNLRELISDVHSISILVRSSVSGLKFGLSLRNGATTYYLTKLCTIPSANTWTLIQLPNIPVWTASAVWNLAAGSVGYYLNLVLACGSTNTSLINDTWQSGALVGASGQSNLFANSGATFDIAYISHEPGAQSSNPPIDCPFTQNLTACQRYFAKSYDYGIAPLAASGNGAVAIFLPAACQPYTTIRFPVTMAKIPNCAAYSVSTGAGGAIRDLNAGIDKATTGTVGAGTGGFNGFSISTPNAGAWQVGYQWTADTGW
jgi:hypothetical protein